MTEKWDVSQIMQQQSKDCIHDWSDVNVEEDQKQFYIDEVKKQIDMLSETDNRSDHFIKCCYDLSLLFILEKIEFQQDESEEIVQDICEVVYNLLTCNYYLHSEIDWDEM